MRRALAIALTAIVAAPAGCGDEERPVRDAGTPAAGAPRPGDVAPDGIDPELLPPAAVPRRGAEPADPAAVSVIKRWTAALRRGDVERAASYFAIPSTFQNATPVLTLDSRGEVVAVNLSLPCGAVVQRARGAGDFTIVTFRLTERRGGDCGTGTGRTTGGAIRVAGGKIREWYRLFDADDPRPPDAKIDPGPEEA